MPANFSKSDLLKKAGMKQISLLLTWKKRVWNKFHCIFLGENGYVTIKWKKKAFFTKTSWYMKKTSDLLLRYIILIILKAAKSFFLERNFKTIYLGFLIFTNLLHTRNSHKTAEYICSKPTWTSWLIHRHLTL